MGRIGYSSVIFLSFFGLGFSQTILSLEKAGAFKRIRIEPGTLMKVEAKKGGDKFGGELISFSTDSVFFPHFAYPLDSFEILWLPASLARRNWVRSLQVASINALLIFNLIFLINELPSGIPLLRPAIRTLVIDAASVSFLIFGRRMLLRKYDLRKKWNLQVLTIPLAP